MSIVLQSSGGGSITVQEPATASNFTISLPATTGTMALTSVVPSFSAYASTSQTLSSATFTKITFDTEEWDTNNNFSSSRFTPTVAGYYQVNGAISNNTATQTVAYIYKNGGQYKQGINGSVFAATASGLVYLNGSTDYVEFFGYFASSTSTNAGVNATYFQACLVRAA